MRGQQVNALALDHRPPASFHLSTMKGGSSHKATQGAHQHSQVIKTTDSKVSFHHSGDVQPWVRPITSLCLSFLIYKTGVVRAIVPSSQGLS